MKLKRVFAIITLLTLVMAMVSGCGKKTASNSDTTPESNATTQTEQNKDTAGDESNASSGNAVEVSIWHYFENEAAALEKIVNDYNEKQDDIHITCTFVSREELMKQYTIGAVSGELPDIGMVDSPDMASYIALGVFEDITDDVQNWEDLKNFYEGPLSSCKDADGRIYGLPNNSNCLALVCNMDLLEKAGFTEPPTTWEELEKIAAATTDPSNSVYGFAMSAISNEEGTFQFIPWLYSAGAKVSALNTPESVRALTFLSDLVSNGYMSKEVVNWSQADAYNAFCAGKAAMLETGTWQVATIDNDVNGKFNYKYAPLPKDKENATVIGGENFGVCVGSEARDACVEFLKYMMSAQNNADWCEIAGKIPVRRDAALLKDFWTKDERYAVFTDSMNFAVARGPHEEWPTISKAIYTAMQGALMGEKAPEDALKEAASVVDPIIAEKPIAE